MSSIKLARLSPRVAKLQPKLRAQNAEHGWIRNDLTPARGLSGQQRKKRNDRIKLDYRYTCQACKRLRLPEDLVIDHRIPLSDGGTEAGDNLQPLCGGKGECHDRKTQAEQASRFGS